MGNGEIGRRSVLGILVGKWTVAGTVLGEWIVVGLSKWVGLGLYLGKWVGMGLSEWVGLGDGMVSVGVALMGWALLKVVDVSVTSVKMDSVMLVVLHFCGEV